MNASRPRLRGRVVTAAIVVVAAVVLVWRVLGREGVASDPPPLVSVITATPQNLPARLVVAGTLLPRATVDLGVREAGTLVSVSAGIGDHVTKGEVLARLDTGELEADVASAQAGLAVAQANAAATSRAYSRVAGIRDTGAIAPEQVDQRSADAAAQRAQTGVASADLAAAEARLDAAEVIAPMDGVIAARNAEPGQFAQPGGPALFTLISDGGLVFSARLPQDQLALVALGMDVTLHLANGSVAAKVTGIDPEIDPVTHLGRVRVALPANKALVPGAFVEASIDLGPHDQLALPQHALVADATGFHVVVVHRGIAEIRPVTLAQVAGNGSGLVPIASGITSGEQIVAMAGQSLRNGEPVRPVN